MLHEKTAAGADFVVACIVAGRVAVELPAPTFPSLALVPSICPTTLASPTTLARESEDEHPTLPIMERCEAGLEEMLLLVRVGHVRELRVPAGQD